MGRARQQVGRLGPTYVQLLPIRHTHWHTVSVSNEDLSGRYEQAPARVADHPAQGGTYQTIAVRPSTTKPKTSSGWTPGCLDKSLGCSVQYVMNTNVLCHE